MLFLWFCIVSKSRCTVPHLPANIPKCYNRNVCSWESLGLEAQEEQLIASVAAGDWNCGPRSVLSNILPLYYNNLNWLI